MNIFKTLKDLFTPLDFESLEKTITQEREAEANRLQKLADLKFERAINNEALRLFHEYLEVEDWNRKLMQGSYMQKVFVPLIQPSVMLYVYAGAKSRFDGMSTKDLVWKRFYELEAEHNRKAI